MKQFNLSALAMACMLAFAGNASAKDIYVSASGNDANDGTSAATAFATLEKAVAAAEKGDVINVAGMVKAADGVVLEGSFDELGETLLEKGAITIQGTDAATDGFNLEDLSGNLIYSKGYDVTLKNLTIQKGGDTALNSEQGDITILHCVFKEIKAGGDGGAYKALNTNTVIMDCQFLENKGNTGGAADIRGGSLKLYNTVFTENYATANAGALNIADLTNVDVQFCTFNDNGCNSRGGAIAIGGGNEVLKFLGCAIVDNTSADHAGAIFFGYSEEKEQKYLFGSCTISGNHCSNAGGAMFNDGPANTEESVLNVVNCTIMGNSTDNNMGNSGGLWMLNSNVKMNIVNTILEGNWAAGNENWSDGWWKETKVSIRNSLVGHIYEWDENEENYSYVNSSVETTPSGTDEPESELNPNPEERENYWYPLVPNSGPTKMGKVEDATAKGVGVDQFGQKWEKTYIGAVQLLEGEEPPVNGIENVVVKKAHDTKFYNVAGQRVSSDAKGIIINNGKKYIVK